MRITEITPMIQTKAEKIRLAAYCRVSSNSEDQLHSFAAQIRYYSEYTRKNPQYELVDIYADEGITGTEMSKRDELNRLLRDCKQGKIDRIITKSVSRFARNTEELLVTLRLLKELGVSVFFEEQGIDTTQLNSEIIVTFPGMVAQQESLSISGNLRWGIQKQMERGEYVGTSPAYGYRLINKKMVIYEVEAVIVKRIYKLFLEGMGKQSIANLLNLEGVPACGGGTWRIMTVHYILTNEKYIGDALFQKKYTTDTLPYRQKRNKGERTQYYVENYCPAIVDKEIFDATQELIKRKACVPTVGNSYTLSKLLKCPECGRTCRRQVVRGKTYWNCSSFSTKSGRCKSRRIREDMVFETFTLVSYKLKANRESLLGSLIRRLEYLQERTSESAERIREIDKAIANLSAQNLVVTRLHASGVIDVPEYNKQATQINNKISSLRIERKKKLNENEGDAKLEELKSFDNLLNDYHPCGEFNVELFNEVVEKIVVEDNTRLTFYLIGDLVVTEEIKEKGRCKIA